MTQCRGNDEARMTKQMITPLWERLARFFVIRHSDFLRHWVFRHSSFRGLRSRSRTRTFPATDVAAQFPSQIELEPREGNWAATSVAGNIRVLLLLLRPRN